MIRANSIKKGKGKKSVKQIAETKQKPEMQIDVMFDYRNEFLQKYELKKRQSVYISESTHSAINKMIRIIGEGEASVSGFVDNVLKRHMEQYQDDINALYEQFKNNLIP